jgi:hypothetical protein
MARPALEPAGELNTVTRSSTVRTSVCEKLTGD